MPSLTLGWRQTHTLLRLPTVGCVDIPFEPGFSLKLQIGPAQPGPGSSAQSSSLSSSSFSAFSRGSIKSPTVLQSAAAAAGPARNSLKRKASPEVKATQEEQAPVTSSGAASSGSITCATLSLLIHNPEADSKAAAAAKSYHAAKITEIEQALRLLTAAEDRQALQVELERRRNSELVYTERMCLRKSWTLRVGCPVRLDGLPYSPMATLHAGEEGAEVCHSLDEVVVEDLLVRVKETRLVKGTLVGEITLPIAQSPWGVAADHTLVFVACGVSQRGRVLAYERGKGQLRWISEPKATFRGLAVNRQHVYVADGDMTGIRVLDREDGKQVHCFGSQGDGPGEFQSPCGLAISGGQLHVTDNALHQVQVFGLDGSFIRMWGSEGSALGQLKAPTGIVVFEDQIYVAEWGNHRIQVFGLDGMHLRSWGSEGSGPGQLKNPYGLAVSEGYVYVGDQGNDRVQVFDRTGAYIRHWGSRGDGDGQFSWIRGVAAQSGEVYVCDSLLKRVQTFQ